MSEEESDIGETSNSLTSSSSDDEDVLIEEDSQDKDFLKTLSYLKNKDPQIYDKNLHFFSQNEDSDKKKDRSKKELTEKPVYIRDYKRNFLTTEVSDEEESDTDHPSMSYNEEQKALKESFKSIMNEESSDDETSSTLLKKKEKEEKEKLEEEKDYIEWLKGKKQDLNDKEIENDLKPLHDFWNNPDLDEKDVFLKDYILNKRYLERDSEGNYDGSDLSEDEKQLEEQEDFEYKYNYRFENENHTNVKRYPRKIEGSLRRKNDVRKRKREEIQKKKKDEKEKKKLEIKKKQKEKLNEVQEKLKKLKEITGNAELGFEDNEILEDFDPDKYDKKMQELYNEKFYSENIEEKPNFSNIYDSDEHWNPDEINMDCEADETIKHKETRSKKKRKKRKSSYKDICDIVKPVFDPEKHSSYQKFIDEYYNLDCEDFIDDIPCRFKYREVVQNDYGLSVEEILMAEDKELNRWVSAKKFCKLRPKHVEKNEVKIYRIKAKDEQLKIKSFPSLYQNDDEEENEVQDNKEEFNGEPNEILENTSNEEIPERKKIKIKANKNNEKSHQTNNTDKSRIRFTIKKKNTFNKTENDPISKISDSRLLAYDIKPKQFRSKLRHCKR